MRVDHDYVINSAKLAHAQGCKQLHVVSSIGVDKNSAFLYNKVKVSNLKKSRKILTRILQNKY